ncbi:MAG: hypothetical protein NT166_22830 [Candidatus Aminicenantes bacterium]|nr:hypothetical protein [Candidatus Aminicenantes bacterium]
MDLQQMNKVLHNVERELGNALISTDVWNIADAESIAGYNSQPMACALFNQITSYINEALEQGKYPKLDKYYILDLQDDKMVLVIPFAEFIWEMLIDTKKARLGILLNSTIPGIIRSFEQMMEAA